MTSPARRSVLRSVLRAFIVVIAFGVGAASCGQRQEVQVSTPQPTGKPVQPMVKPMPACPYAASSTGPSTPLNAEEERVIVHKGTERPFSGKFVDHHADGTYTCRRCGAPLFASDAKFDSKSGWPSFDEALPGAVREVPDADGDRTEIVCAKCSAHLGHVFRGEGFSERDTRHCVNSVSLEFEPARPHERSDAGPGNAAETATAVAYFAGGCFWGVEHLMQQAPGVLDVVSGYMGGSEANPSYEMVSANATGHAETVKVTYNPSRTSYAALARLFFEIHDPTQVGRQGPDVGAQYRSVIFVSSDQEREVARHLIQKLTARGYRVATQIETARQFWPAEAYHQDYYTRTHKQPYCHTRVSRFGNE